MFFIMLSLTISLIIVIFALQNSGMVPIVFFNWSSEIPLVVVIFASVFAGAAIIFFLALWKEVKRKFNTVYSKATEYKGIVNFKKGAQEQSDQTELMDETEVAQAEGITNPSPKAE